jgi:two-component system LytT family response regulator
MCESINTILVDDNKKDLDTLQVLLKPYNEIKIIAQTTNSTEAIEIITTHKPDLIFLDIYMPEMNGFQLLDTIKPLNLDPCIIFTTLYDEYAIKAIRYSAFDFLVKPIDREELANAIDRFKNNSEAKTKDQIKNRLDNWYSNKKLKFNTQHNLIFIEPKDIIYLKANCNYTSIIMANNNEELISTNIGTLEKQLPSPPFFRVSRSAIINTNYMQKVDKKNKECLLIKANETFKLKITRNKIKELEKIV